MSKKRASSYFRARLRRDHPLVYGDLLAGRFASVRQAALAAGLIRLPTALQGLKREWNKASPQELSGDMENCTGGDMEKCTTFD
jgi:hypothetical protein